MLTENVLTLSKAWYLDYNMYRGYTSALSQDRGIFRVRLPGGSYFRTNTLYPPAVSGTFDVFYVNLWDEYINCIKADSEGSVRLVQPYWLPILALGESGTPETVQDYKMGSPLSANELTALKFDTVGRTLIKHGYNRGKMKHDYRVYLKNTSGRTLHIRELGRFMCLGYNVLSLVEVMVERQTFPEIVVPPDDVLIFTYSTVY